MQSETVCCYLNRFFSRCLRVALKNEGGPGGHAYVITSITYTFMASPTGNVLVPLSVKLRDPWPENPSFQTVSWADVQRRFLGLVYLNVVR